MPSETARMLADRLAHIARRVAELQLLEPTNVVEVSVGDGDRPNRVTVHHCEPEQLEAIARTVARAEPNWDADRIMRWVSIEDEAFELTYFRR